MEKNSKINKKKVKKYTTNNFLRFGFYFEFLRKQGSRFFFQALRKKYFRSDEKVFQGLNSQIFQKILY